MTWKEYLNFFKVITKHLILEQVVTKHLDDMDQKSLCYVFNDQDEEAKHRTIQKTLYEII